MNQTLTYPIPDGATEGVRALLHAVREGRAKAVPELLGPLPDAERRRCLPVLRQWRTLTRNNSADGRWSVRAALLLAGAGCCTGAAAAAQWLASSDLWWYRDDPPRVLAALAGRDPEWLGQVAHRLAKRRTLAEEEYPLIAHLVQAAGCAPPTTDGFVLGWERSIRAGGMTIRDRLRRDPFLEVMVPRLFEVPEAGADFPYCWSDDPGWPDALAGLAEEGRLSRPMLIDGCLSRLLRGGRLGLVKGFLALLTALDLTEDERAAHTATWVRMVPDGHPLVVARAQEVLAGLDEAGRLADEHLVEASRAALFRPEKKVVRAQLTLLDRAMRRDRSRTNELLWVVAEAFGHEEHSLQERALALAARHRKHASGAVLAQLAASAGQLSQDLRTRAAADFGDAATTAADGGAPATGDEVLPPVPVPERLGPVPATAAELAEETGVLLRRDGTPAAWERVLNGLVVHAHTDLTGLRAALEPVVAARRQPIWTGGYLQGLELVVISVLGMASRADHHDARRRALTYQCPHSAIHFVSLLRAAEIGTRLVTDPLPFLLATPTWSTGTIEASELVERLARYERAGTEPAQADFLQALLRLEREAPSEAREAAAELRSEEGRQLAAWLASGGLPDPATSRGVEPLGERTPHPGVLVGTEAVAGHEHYPEPFRSLLGAHDPINSPCACGGGAQCSPRALAVLPQHREVLAARMLVTVGNMAEFDDIGEGVPVLPALAAADGPAGPATHLLLAYGLGARRPEEQLLAVEAMLLLAAHGQLDAARLGADIAELLGLGRRLKLQRVVTALREAVRTGAHGTVWAVLSAALPSLLRGRAPHGLSEALTLAAECAEQYGARGAIPGIDALAARSGSAQSIRQARRIKKLTEAPAGG